MRLKSFKAILLIVLALTFGCDYEPPATNNHMVGAYAKYIRGGGEGVDYVDLYYISTEGGILAQGGMFLGRLCEDSCYWKDQPTGDWGYCNGVSLCGPDVTDEEGFVRITRDEHYEDCVNHQGGPGEAHRVTALWGYELGGLTELPDSLTNWPGVGQLFRPNDGMPRGKNPFPRQPSTPPTVKGNLTERAVAMLEAPVSGSASAPMGVCGIDSNSIDPNMINLPTHLVYEFRIVQQCGPSGHGYSVEVGDLLARDVPRLESNMRYQIPLKVEAIAVFPSPQDVLGCNVTLEVASSIDSVLLNAEIVAVNDSGTLAVGLSDYFIPVKQDIYDTLTAQGSSVIFDRWSPISDEERHLYDPNMYEDPNDFPNLTIDTLAPDFMERHDHHRMRPLNLLRVETGDPLLIRVESFDDLIMKGCEQWLSTDSLIDVNNDGIVNFTDYLTLLF
jgi:hypothetical protein